MAADLRRVKELFVAALEVPAGEARNAFLQQACGEDAALRERVEVLLAAHDVPVSALDKPLAGGSCAASVDDRQRAATAGPRGHASRRPLQAARTDRRGGVRVSVRG